MNKKGFTYTLQIDAEIKDLIAKTNQVKQSMQSIIDSGKASGAEKVFSSIEKAIDKLQSKASQPIESIAAFSSLQKDASAVGASLKQLGSIIDSLGNMSLADKMDLLPADLKKKIEGANIAIVEFANIQEKAAEKTQDLIDAEKNLLNAQNNLKKAEGKVSDKKALVEAQQQLVNSTRDEANAIKAKIDAIKKFQATAVAYESAGGDKRKIGGGKPELAGLNYSADRKAAQGALPGVDLNNTEATALALTRLAEEYRQANKAVTDSEASWRKYNKQLNEANTEAVAAETKVNSLSETVKALNQEFEQNKAKNTQNAYAKLRTEAVKLGIDLTDIPIKYTEQGFADLNEKLNQLAIDGLTKVDNGLGIIQTEMQETSDAAKSFGDKVAVSGEEIRSLDATVSNTTAFTQRIAQFVGLQGGIEIARAAMRNAISTIKDLDAAMTEMAVVTDLGVGDYWDQLPDYTERANALGVSIKAAYESATLYYQQGLKTNEVVAMSNETLKMARIAGLSAEDATNKMTAALRGFNMELNEVSAQRIADVYSELAAITASDVDEISSAMTKTASIAASAGMEFETTAAFLSQIIETTRESAETAGTALKTVIARFQELKKDPSEIGEVDGEIVDANKIETALRSVGVALRDSSGQFRELDDVFLELSSKWDSLDTNTQRYIATIAAGSRQQSRFIAMMSDYSRTQELVTAANTSAGASNEQFNKTLDSLESKLNKLKNAWDSFTMDMMNSELLKTGIDIITGIITAINKVSDSLGNFSGVAKIGILVSALYLGDKALNVFNKSIKEGSTIFSAFGKIGSTATSSIKKTMMDLTKAIKNTTRQEKQLNLVLQSTCGSSTKLAAAKEKVKRAQKELNDLEKSGTATSSQLAAAKRNLAEQEALLNIQQTANKKIRQESQAMVALGLSTTQAEILALQGHTAAEVQNLIAKEMSNNLSAEEARQRVLCALGIRSETGALTLNDLVRRNGILNFLTQLGLLILGKKSWKDITKEENKNTGSKLLNIVATLAQAAANGTLLATMLPILAATVTITIAMAALVGVIMLIVAAIKAVKANSPEGKLKAAQEASEAVGEAANEAAEAYKNLADSFDNLAHKYDALEELTAGTREWRDAIREINSEVLGLVEQYPELANLVKNEDGVLTLDIDSEEVQAVLDKYEAESYTANAAKLASQISVNQAQQAVDYKALSDQAELGNQDWIATQKVLAGMMTMATLSGKISGNVWGANLREQEAQNKANTEAMALALADGLVMQNEEGDWKVTSTEGTKLTEEQLISFAEELGDGAEELKKYGEAVRAREEQERALYEAMALNAVQLIDTAKMTEDEIQQINVAASADYAKIFEEQASKTYQTELDSKSKEEKKAYAKAKAQELYGTDEVKVDGKGNVTIGTGDNATTISAEEFKKQIAASEGSKLTAEALKSLPRALNSMAEKMGSAAGTALEKTYMAKEGGAMTKENINNLKAYQNNAEKLEALYDSLSDEEKNAFGDIEHFKNHIKDSITLAENAFATATKTLEEMGGIVELNNAFTTDSAKGYADQLEVIMSAAGQAGVDAVDSTLDRLASTMSETDLNKFMGQLNAMDWKSMEDWENLPDLLEQIGLNVPTVAFEEFVSVAQRTAGALYKIDLKALNEQMLSLASLSNKIKSGEQGRNLSSSDYEALIKADPKLAGKFQQTLSGDYVYLGSSMEELTKAIEDNTDAILNRTTDQLQNKVDTAELMQDINSTWRWADNQKIDVVDWRSWDNDGSVSNTQEYLKAFIKQADESGIDLSKIGVEGLSNDTKVSKLNEEQIANIMDGLVGVFNALDENSRLLNEEIVQSLSLTYQNRDATSNAMEAINLRRKVAGGGVLNNDEENALKASTNTVISQAVVAGVNSVDVQNYTETIANLEALREEYEKGTIKLEEFTAQYSYFSKVATNFERTVVNKTNLSKMNSALQTTMEKISGLGEKFELVGDEAERMEIVAQMVESFGIQVDKSNYEQLANLATTMVEGGKEGYAAFEQLMVQAGKAYEITYDDVVNMSVETWNDSTKPMSESMQRFAEAMIASGNAMWEEMEDGSKRFIWLTEGILTDNAKLAGTLAEAWENPYTWLYNYNEEINRLIRERERAERDYTRALESESSTTAELLQLSKDQLTTLEEEAKIQATAAARAQQEINTLFGENGEFAKYVQYNAETGSLLVDYNGLEVAGYDTDKGSDFEEFLSAIEENRDVILDAEDALYDIEDEIKEISDRGKEETSELYDKIKEGLVQSRQNEIAELQNINDSIQEAQSTLVDQMQKQIDEARQARENEKTEEEISDKEARLAYLMRDTSGSNALEIAQLQKEIAEQKEGYSDSLVDQQLQNLQDANEKAAEQRQQQIDLAQAQLDAYSESSVIWNDVQEILLKSLLQAQTSGDFDKGWMETEAQQYIGIAEGIDSLNPVKKDELKDELTNNAKLASLYNGVAGLTPANAEATLGRVLNGDISSLSSSLSGAVNTTTEAVNTSRGVIEKVKTDTSILGTKISGGAESINLDAGVNTQRVVDAILEREDSTKGGVGAGTSSIPETGYTGGISGQILGNGKKPSLPTGDKQAILFDGDGPASIKEPTTEQAITKAITTTSAASKVTAKSTRTGYNWEWKDFKNGKTTRGNVAIGKDNFILETEGKVDNGELLARIARAKGIKEGAIFHYAGGNGYEQGYYMLDGENGTSVGKIKENARDWEDFISKIGLSQFKTGGLADFTGPAWLDGTRSKPEIVLNQTDSANFLQLRDILADVLNGTSGLPKTEGKAANGDNYYDVEISVESLGSDYDVEQLADKVRSMIYDDATYRNVNAINNIR